MTTSQIASETATFQTASRTPGWWLVARRELSDLWMGGRGVILLIAFSILLGVLSFLLATNSELKLIPPREMVFMILQITIAVGLFVGLLIAADSISGERERATLEGLLLVPTSRRQIVLGKFIAATSWWPAGMLVASAHIAVLSPNQDIMAQALLLGISLGSLLVLGFTSFGTLLSMWSNSNRNSLMVSLFIGVLFLLPTQLPGTAQTGFMGRLVKRINPMESVNQILEKMLVNNRGFDEMASWLAAPVIFAVVAFGLLFWYAAPRLDFDGERARIRWPRRAGSIRPILLLFALIWLLPFNNAAAQSAAEAPFQVQISIDTDYRQVRTGDTIEFSTIVRYDGAGESPPMLVAMNIVNLGEGDPVDPEDWSPERTQEVPELAPGETAEQSWTINAILEGDYLAYMVVIPEPSGAENTSLPVASPGMHLIVSQFSPLNPAGIAPVALGMPIALTLLLVLQRWLRRRTIEVF